MTQSWKSPEEDNMSIGELAEYLLSFPAEIQHLPVKLLWEGHIFPVNKARFDFTDGKRYYAESLMKGKATYTGIYLELYAEHMG
jgi:hypothetical protein